MAISKKAFANSLQSQTVLAAIANAVRNRAACDASKNNGCQLPFQLFAMVANAKLIALRSDIFTVMPLDFSG